jgi:hypothetical protein
MAFYIRDKEACCHARELADLLGVTAEEAVNIAVKERLERLISRPNPETTQPQPQSPKKSTPLGN